MMRELLALVLMAATVGAAPPPAAAAAPTAPAQPTAPASSAPPGSVQAAFEDATAAFDAQRWAEALADYDALAARLGPGARRSQAIVAVRRGIALLQLDRTAAAGEALRGGLAGLSATDATLASDRYLGNMALGRVEVREFEPLAAVAAFHAAERDAADHDDTVAALVGAVRTELYLDPPAALADIDRALALVPTAKRETLATLRTLRGRTLLNAGRYPEARKDLLAAVDLLGGLGLKVRVADLAARSDLAIVSLLLGDAANAKKYLAYSGAGTLEDGFARGADMDPPPCDAAAGIDPKDVVVVEFGIADNGTVAFAAPVYTSHPGAGAAAFALAAASWSWAPEKLAKIPGLFRLTTRVELRCSTANARPATESVLHAALDAWLQDRHLPLPPSSGVEAADLPKLRAALAATPAGTLAQVPLLVALQRNRAAPEPERRAAAGTWAALVLATDPPPMVRAAAGIAAAVADSDSGRAIAKRTDALLADPAIAADPRATAALRLRLADAYFADRHPALAKPLVAAVVADPRLTSGDPLHVAALVRQSAIAAGEGDLTTARAAFEATGLSEAQCALIDVRPSVVRAAGGERDYPAEAVTWGISGWAVTEFDIAADGTPRGVRAIAAYPPFVFDTPTVKIMERTRFTQTYRAGGGLGCGGYQKSQGFRVVR